MKSNRLAIAILIVTGLTAASCAGPKEVRLAGNGDIPAAESTVKVGTNENGNTTFDLTVKHLALPQRVDPPPPSMSCGCAATIRPPARRTWVR